MKIEDLKEIPEILLVDKPKGITSFDCIRILRKKTGIKKMGHAGTLDPNATGLLIIGIGNGTSKLSGLIGLSKVYEAEIQFGIKTDTGDTDGKIVETKNVPALNEKNIQGALAKIIGEISLPVPLYSAVKREGKRLYEYAHKNQDVELPLKKMGVLSAELLSFDTTKMSVKFNVTSGTYIRSLAEKLGELLGTVATLSNLRRLSIGEYKIEDAITLN